MKPSLAPGVEGEASFEVLEDMSPPHLPTKVLSTPSMIQMMEQACLSGCQPHLEETETTVGTHVCVSHSAAAMAGETVRISYQLTDIERSRFLTFDVQAHVGDRLLGEGTHQRAIVDTSRFD